MEGVGSRLGRASSRYGPTATSTVFNGPVRKWEKKWVHVAPSSPSTATTPHHAAQSNGHNSAVSPLLLRRWTPLPPPAEELAVGEGDAGDPPEEPPRRKFRYTPIVVLEEQKKVAEKKAEAEEKTRRETDQSTARPAAASASNEAERKPIIADGNDKEEDFKKETQVTEKCGARGSNSGDLDLGLGLKGPEDDISTDSIGETEIQTEKASGFWSTGIET